MLIVNQFFADGSRIKIKFQTQHQAAAFYVFYLRNI